VRDFNLVYVGSESKSVFAVMSAARPLFPHEQTFAGTPRTAVWCQELTSVVVCSFRCFRLGPSRLP